MKHLKVLAISAIAAMALMAFASTASADVLCKAAPNKSGECPTASGDYASGTTFVATSTNPVLTVTGGLTPKVTCKESKVELKNSNTGSNTPGGAVSGEVTDLTFTNDCTTEGGTSCTITTTKGYNVSIIAVADNGNGSVHITGNSIKTTVTCGAFFSCEYSPVLTGMTVDLTGGNPATVKASSEPLHLTAGIGCGSAGIWHADYTLTSPNSAVWVATKMD
jgi:hypothetical protein